ncbi:helix-turn-helix domain-containing protein [Edaphobacter paludis]|uniref:helix-turn-helix domain-containing protein n=1 Tax=Edaphobacter paludis TaxID=3035702 RepID=UPI0035A07E28
MRGRSERTALQPISTEYLTSQEVASILKVSPDSIIRWFEKRPGVVDLGSGESRFKRRYRVLRIPKEALETFIVESRVQ